MCHFITFLYDFELNKDWLKTKKRAQDETSEGTLMTLEIILM